MTDTITPILSVIATSASRLSDLSIKDGQLVFVKDKQYIALDIDNKRVFYNQIISLKTDEERQSILAPIKGLFYFVVSTAVLWTYEDSWIQITTQPNEVVFIGVELPELGSANTLYVNKQNKEISVWDDDMKSYMVVADKMDEITEEEILLLFE